MLGTAFEPLLRRGSLALGFSRRDGEQARAMNILEDWGRER